MSVVSGEYVSIVFSELAGTHPYEAGIRKGDTRFLCFCRLAYDSCILTQGRSLRGRNFFSKLETKSRSRKRGSFIGEIQQTRIRDPDTFVFTCIVFKSQTTKFLRNGC